MFKGRGGRYFKNRLPLNKTACETGECEKKGSFIVSQEQEYLQILYFVTHHHAVKY